MYRVGVLISLAAAGAGLTHAAAGSWLTYHGNITGNRSSALAKINTTNVNSLVLERTFAIPNAPMLETTPLVYGSSMFITSGNSLYVYSLLNGKLLWSQVRPNNSGLVQDAAGGVNRGAAIAPAPTGSTATVYYMTNDAHLVALNAATGAMLWESVVADFSQNYGSTGAPLYLPGMNLVVAGVSGGDAGIRGFLSAYNATTGALAWKFYTTPATTTDPGGATWGDGSVLPHGCGATWNTGTFDESSKLLYWGVGNPCPDLNGDGRKGDNLYTSSMLALDAATGTLKWHFQFTPHNLWDFDGANTPMLIDAAWEGKPRHLMFQANRNGYFYVLDRMTGQYLSSFPFVTNLNWSSGVDAHGRPMVDPAATPTPAGVLTCPSSAGAANWPSAGYSTATGLFYVQVNEACSYRAAQSPANPWLAGTEYNGGTNSLGQVSEKYLRAINPSTGVVVWEYPEPGYHPGYGGVLSTAGGLIFVGEDSGAFAALDAVTGAVLWRYQSSATARIKASPMTYEIAGRQFVSLAVGSSVLVFGLPPKSPAMTETCPLESGQLNTPYNSTPSVSGGTPPYTYALGMGGLPPGLTLDGATGIVSGTPLNGGTWVFGLKVADSAGNHTLADCGMTVSPMPFRLTGVIGEASLGVPYGAPLLGRGGLLPYTFSITSGNLPAGLSLNTTTGIVSGTPTAYGGSTFTAQAVDASGTAAGTATVNVGIAVGRAPVVSCPLNTATAGAAYSSAVTAAGGRPPYVLYSLVNGTLPPGLTLDNATGSVSGTATASGTYGFTVGVADASSTPAGAGTGNCVITVP